MSSLTDTVTVPLPQEAIPANRLKRVWRAIKDYFRVTGWLFLIRISFRLMDPLAIAAVTSQPDRAPPLILAMSPSPLVAGSVAQRTSFAVFFLVAMPRVMLPDFVNYLFGKRSIDYVQRTRGPRWLIRAADWTAKRHPTQQLGVLFFFSLVQVPLLPVNAYNMAGAAKTRLFWVMAISLVTKAVWVFGLYKVGSMFDPLGSFKARF